jgi:hypothetical protein
MLKEKFNAEYASTSVYTTTSPPSVVGCVRRGGRYDESKAKGKARDTDEGEYFTRLKEMYARQVEENRKAFENEDPEVSITYQTITE